METTIQSFIKRIVLFGIAAFTFTSCIYYEESYPSTGSDGRNGNAYVRLNWNEREPDYIETDNIIPSNFYWNTYYRTMPGYYTIRYEYDYDNGYRIITDAYEADVEVWVNYGEMGGVNYNGRNGADSYFDMELYPDGGFDFTSISRQKSSGVLDSLHAKPMGVIDSVTTVQNGVTMKVIYKRVEPRITRIKK